MLQWAINYFFVPLILFFIVGLYSPSLKHAWLRSATLVVAGVLVYFTLGIIAGKVTELPQLVASTSIVLWLLLAWAYYSIIFLLPCLAAASFGYGVKYFRKQRNDSR